MFEGEYLYNQRIRGREYIHKILEYEGDYSFGRKWNGKGFNVFGDVIYELKDGNGKVKEYLDNSLIFEGEYLNGKKNGKGREYLYNKLIFKGEFMDGKRLTGIGTEEDFEGEYLFGKRWKGEGKEYFRKELIFRGDYNYGKRWNGIGKEYDEHNQLIFEGEYILGLRQWKF